MAEASVSIIEPPVQNARRDAAPEPAGATPTASTPTPGAGLSASARRRRAGWLVAALGVAVGFALLPYLSGLLGGQIVAVVGAPAFRHLRAKVGRRTAAMTVTAAALFLLLLPGALLVAGLAAQAPATLDDLTTSTWYQRIAALDLGPIHLGSVLALSGSELSTWASRQAGSIVSSMADTGLNLLIALFGAYYTLVSGRAVWTRIASRLPFERATAERLRQRFHEVTEAMILGILATAFVQGSIVAGAFALVGLPHALFWGFVTGCASILPVLGSALVWLPGSVILALDGRFGRAVTLFAIGAVVASNLDNVVRPIVYRRVSGVHPMVTLVGAFAGVRLLGLAGLLIGPLAISYLIELVAAFEAEQRSS